MNTTAYITLHWDHLHAHTSDDTGFCGPALAVLDFLCAQHVAADSVTMPHKDNPASPTTGQRIAIYCALHADDRDEIEARRKRQEANDFANCSVRVSGFV